MKLKNYIYKIIILAAVTLYCPKIYAQDLANFSSAFVDIGFGARPLGMGHAFSAITDDANAILWNPAGIAEVEGFEGTVSYTKLFNLIPYSFASLVYSPSTKIAIAGGLIISGDDLFREISLISCGATKFYLKGHQMNLGFSLTLHNASFGKNDPSHISVSGDALGYSLGWGMQFYLTKKIVLASHLQNLFNSIHWNSSTIGKYQEGLPRRWIIGVGFKNFHQINFDLDFHKSLYQDIEDKFYIGAERIFLNKFSLRAGTATSIDQAQNQFYSFGGGFNHCFSKRFCFQLDVAYVVHPLENMFRSSLTFHIK